MIRVGVGEALADLLRLEARNVHDDPADPGRVVGQDLQVRVFLHRGDIVGRQVEGQCIPLALLQEQATGSILRDDPDHDLFELGAGEAAVVVGEAGQDLALTGEVLAEDVRTGPGALPC